MASTNEENITYFGIQQAAITSFSRDELQDFLDLKVRRGRRTELSVTLAEPEADLRTGRVLAQAGWSASGKACATYGFASSGVRMPYSTLVRASMLSARASMRSSPSSAAALACSVR